MELILDLSKWLGSCVIKYLLPKSFSRAIELGSDLSSAFGALLIMAILAILIYLIL